MWCFFAIATIAAASKRPSLEHVEGRYIVRLCDDSKREHVAKHIETRHLSSDRTFQAVATHHFKRLSKLPALVIESATLEAVEELRRLEWVCDVDQVTVKRPMALEAPWHLDRINQAQLPLDGNASFGRYTGKGVNIFLLDGGMDTSHPEFDGVDVLNVYSGYDPKFWHHPEWPGWTDDTRVNTDDDGHGTHVTALAVGNSVGVAPGATLYHAKICEENAGCPDDLGILLIDAVAELAATGQIDGNSTIISMSVGGSCASRDASYCSERAPYARAIASAREQGISVVVAAGNTKEDACFTEPASAADAIAVGATNKRDQVADFSNYGGCVSMFAPGVRVRSAEPKNRDNGKYSVRDGTSMSTPLAAGVLALFMEAGANIDAFLNAATLGVLRYGRNKGAGRSDCITNDMLLRSPPRTLDNSPAFGKCPYEDDDVETDDAFSFSFSYQDDVDDTLPDFTEHDMLEERGECNSPDALCFEGVADISECWTECAKVYLRGLAGAEYREDLEECCCKESCECLDQISGRQAKNGFLLFPTGSNFPQFCESASPSPEPTSSGSVFEDDEESFSYDDGRQSFSYENEVDDVVDDAIPGYDYYLMWDERGECNSPDAECFYSVTNTYDCWAECSKAYGRDLVGAEYYENLQQCCCKESCQCLDHIYGTQARYGYLLFPTGSEFPQFCETVRPSPEPTEGYYYYSDEQDDPESYSYSDGQNSFSYDDDEEKSFSYNDNTTSVSYLYDDESSTKIDFDEYTLPETGGTCVGPAQCDLDAVSASACWEECAFSGNLNRAVFYEATHFHPSKCCCYYDDLCSCITKKTTRPGSLMLPADAPFPEFCD